MKLYGKDSAISLTESMIRRGRLPHAFLVVGEKGLGKKTLCRYIAMQALCEEKSGKPCGVCPSCKKLIKNIHPDLIEITPGGKSGNYLSDELRAIVSDSTVAPNEGDKKIYFLPGIDKALPEAQNMLLKVVEEPPEHVMFLMTAESRDKILPTILSRVISLGISEPSEDECLSALLEAGRSEEESRRAISVFGGNIGFCLEYLENGESLPFLDILKKLVDAVCDRDEFRVAAAFAMIDPKQQRAQALEILSGLKGVIRDVVAIKNGASACSLYRSGAKKLAERMRQSSAERIYGDISTAERRIAGNASVQLILSDLSGALTE